jgi:hypothetical protein
MCSCNTGHQIHIPDKNEDFLVEILKNGKWKEIPVHNAKVSDYVGNPEAGYQQYNMGFAMFTDDFKEPVKVRVTKKDGFNSVCARPTSYGIEMQRCSNKKVEFTITDPGKKISVEFDGDRMQNLFILPDLPDAYIPVGDNVIYYGPGIHDAGEIKLEWWNNATIYIDSEAIVYGRIVANRCDSLTIRGRGILCSSKENHGEGRRPQIETYACNHLTIEGIMLRDTPNWTIKVVGSDHVHVNNIKEIGWIMNSDGMDFLCCRHVLVENTFQRNYDDNVTIKAFNASPEYIRNNSETDGSYKDGTIGMVEGLDKFDVYDIEVRNCVFWADKAHNMLVGPESRGVTFSDIHFHDNIVLENRQDDDTYPGTMAVMIADNGTFSDITFSDIEVEDINGGKVLCIQFTNAWAYGNKYGQWAKNITIEKIRYKGHRSTASKIYGLNSTQKIDGVKISDFTVNGEKILHPNTNLDVNEYVEHIVFE